MAASINYIKSSDGTGNANTATVQNPRVAPATTIKVDTVTGIPTYFCGTMGTPHTFSDPVTGEDITVISEATAVDFKGHVDGSNLEIDEIAPGYTDGGSAVGDIVIVRPTTQWSNNVAEVLEVEHNQDGTHGDITATSVTTDSLTITGSASAEGWSALGSTLTYSSNDGNKQATYTITGVDKTGTIQEGMKVKLPRPTTVGTQCTDLEASSSQYASKSSPGGITFTDDFTCGAWIKLESYGDGTNEMSIISRFLFNTGGFVLRVETNGALHTVVMNGATTDEVACYQSLPINKWVHVAQGIDLSTDTFTTYINGVSVSTYEVDSHTLSAIVQAGDLEIGSFNGGSDYFDGKIKHAFVADKVLSAAEVKEAMVSDDLTSASFSANLDAYFKLEGDFTDSSANGNDLTASGGAVATDADSPFSSTEYGIITSATFSTDTTVTVFTGDGVPVNEDVTAPSYSTHRVPYGFPAGKDKWKVETITPNTDITGISIGGTNQWYASTAIGLFVPIGSWTIAHSGTYTQRSTIFGARTSVFTLSDATVLPATAGDYTHPLAFCIYELNATASLGGAYRETDIKNTSTTTFYPRCSIKAATGTETWEIRGSYGPNIYTAYCNYL